MRTIIIVVLATLAVVSGFPQRFHPGTIGSEALLGRLEQYDMIQPKMSKFAPASAADSELYPATLSVEIVAFNKTFQVELTRNEDILDSEYKQVRMEYSGEGESAEPTQIDEPVSAYCFYHGRVAGDENSIVALSTCEGYSGFIQAHGEFMGIEPAMVHSRHANSNKGKLQSFNGAVPTRRQLPLTLASNHREQHDFLTASHVVYRMSDYKPSNIENEDGSHSDDLQHCGVEGQTIPTQMPVSSEETEPTQSAATSAEAGVKYIELLVVNDRERYQLHGSRTEHDTLEIVNMISEMYKRTQFVVPLRVVLVGQVTMTRNAPYSVPMAGAGVETQGSTGLLQNFNTWKQTAPIKKADTVQLFSGLNFAHGILGLANVQQMCVQQYSATVTTLKEPSLVQNAIIAAHETGHTLGMLHDGSGNACPMSGFIMASIAGIGADFSQCSIQSANSFISNYQPACLNNVPATGVDNKMLH